MEQACSFYSPLLCDWLIALYIEFRKFCSGVTPSPLYFDKNTSVDERYRSSLVGAVLAVKASSLKQFGVQS
jgi:hypothetical protein